MGCSETMGCSIEHPLGHTVLPNGELDIHGEYKGEVQLPIFYSAGTVPVHHIDSIDPLPVFPHCEDDQ